MMNKKLILIFLTVNILAVNIYAQPCFTTVKQIDSLIEQLKLHIPVTFENKKWIYTKEDSLHNWLDSFPVQLCKKLPLFESKKIRDYTYTQRQLEYMILLNFYRNSSDTAIKKYIATKLYRAKYYDFFYNRPETFSKDTSEMLLKVMTDYTKKSMDTSVLKKILIANRNEKNKKLPAADTISAEDYKTDSSAYCKGLFNNDEMDYFVFSIASDLKLLRFAPWLENKVLKKEYNDIISEYRVTQALARMRYKDYYANFIKGYENQSVYIEAVYYAPEVLYVGCKECFNEWLKQLSDTTTRVVMEYKNSEYTSYDTVYIAKYVNECLFTLFATGIKNWNKSYPWFFWGTYMRMEHINNVDKKELLPYNRDKLQKFINEGYPFYVSWYYYKYTH